MRLTTVVCALVLSAASPLSAQPRQLPEGIFQGYDGELQHASSQLVALADVIPDEKFTWRPAEGVRSTSEVCMHIAIGNFFLLSLTGAPMPSDVKPGMDKSVTAKPEVIAWLKRSVDAVKDARAKATPEELQRKVDVFGRSTTVEAVFLRVIVHVNEHMGQLIAYARMNGVTPPWSQ